MRLPRATLALAFAVIVNPAAAVADKWDDTIQQFRNSEAPGPYFNEADGFAIFPTIGKGGIGIGGAYGEGRVYEQGTYVGNTDMGQITIGFQFGGQAYSQLIFFQDKRAFDEFTSGRFEFGAEASAVALTAGANAKAGTTGHTAGASGGRNNSTNVSAWYRGMMIFTIAKGGLMYEASIGGQKFNYQPRS